VLTRKAGERILIGTDISIEVVRVSNSNVRLRILAPDSVPVWRAEIRDADASLGPAPQP
jgi:carbon storage regulator